MNFLFKYFAKRIIVDAHPSRFLFTRTDNQKNFSVATFVYVDNSNSRSSLLSVGEEIPSNYLSPHIHKISVFDTDDQLPPQTTLSRDDLIEIIFEYGLGHCFIDSFLPALRPVVFILGADRFASQLKNARERLEKAAKLGGAREVVFDKIEL